MDFLGLSTESLWFGLGGVIFFLLLGMVLGKINGLIERRVNLLGKLMAVPALIAATVCATYVGYVFAQYCSDDSRLHTPGGKIYLIVFIALALSCAWRARQLAVIMGYAAIVFVGIGGVIWWIMGGN